MNWLLITITITFFSKWNRLQLQITLQSKHDYFWLLLKELFLFEDLLLECYPEERKT